MFAIENLRKTFVAPGNVIVNAVDDVSLSIETGKLITLLGPSGCGKTTTLRCLAGLERPESGKIVIANQTMYDSARGIFVSPSDRGIGMVFQSYAIWPHMTVFENVAYGLRVRRKSAAEIKEKVGAALDLVQMGGFADRNASQLSGGQQQRVALARAYAFSPSVLLFDEPLSNLDAKLRGDMRIELRELQHRLGVTSLYVTHDLEEALAMSDVIVVMRGGHIEQHGSPEDIYNRPRTEFVADFVGSANLIRGRLRPDLSNDDLVAVESDGGHVVYGTAFGRAPGPTPTLAIRTVHLDLQNMNDKAARNVWPVTVKRTVFLGDLSQIHVDWGGRELIIRRTGIQTWSAGQPAFLSAEPGHCVLLEGS
jgi:ABC-type Fe3+/spermidine/putrescine transport system ATPase subunit